MRIKKLTLLIFIIFFVGIDCFATDIYDESVLAIDRGLAKKEDVILMTALNHSVGLYKKQPNDKYLARVIKRFDKILKRKDAYFIIENFLGIYLGNKKKFEEILSKSLSKGNKKKFMEYMHAIVDEMQKGNG